MSRDAAGSHQAKPARAAAALALVALAGWSVRDFLSWRELGVGGLPHTLSGWLRVTALRMMGRNPFMVPPGAQSDARFLSELPARSTSRAMVDPHPIPHRVRDQHASPELIDALCRMFDQYLELKEPTLEYRTSQWELHNNALHVSTPELPHQVSRSANGELGHVHRIDGSIHVTLAPKDATEVIDKGWGELHPLAGKRTLPATYTLLYPPQDADDLPQIRQILEAAISYMSDTAQLHWRSDNRSTLPTHPGKNR